MGNLDDGHGGDLPLAHGAPDLPSVLVDDYNSELKDRAGFIFNLGHGIHKETPPENVAALVDFVHQYRP